MSSASDRASNGLVVVLGELPDGDRVADRMNRAIRTTADVETVDSLAVATAIDCLVVVHDPDNDDRIDQIEQLASGHPTLPIVAYVLDDDPTTGSAVVAAGADEYVPASAFDSPETVLMERISHAKQVNIGTSRAVRSDLFDAITDPIVVHPMDDEAITLANDEFCSTFGYERHDVIGKDVSELSPLDRLERTPADHLQRAIETGRHTFEWALERADGEVVPTEVTLSPIEISGTEYILGVVRDISDRKEHERELKTERAFTEAIFASLPDVFYAFDETGQFLRWNDRFAEVTGYDDKEIESMHPIDFFPESEQSRIAERIAEVVEHGHTVTVEAPFLTKEGERIPYEFTGGQITDESGEMIGLVGIGRDISDRKQHERRFEAVFNNTYQFTGLMEPDGTLLEVNETALEFGGFDREEVIGRYVWKIGWFQPYEESVEGVKEGVERASKGEFYRTELPVSGENGTEIIDFSIRPITDDRGNVTLLIPEGRTITELKQRERHLNVLHRFLRHNLRNKLTVINGNASLLEEQLEGTDKSSYAGLIEGASTDLIELGETAHELSKIVMKSDGDRRPVDPTAVLSHLSETFRENYPEALIDTRIETDRPVVADWRLEAVFEQLIENAIEHTDSDQPSVTITVSETDDAVLVKIADNGPGIPEEELVGITSDKEPTQIAHGTGFGLWLVRSVLDDYGADLTYDSSPDGGSVLTAVLPKASEPAGEEPSPEYGTS